ncbi:MAG: hypothetical protein OXI77_05540 [Chloroflexota bacterium]|nr:hypothetical protein [Chloroflexota bacterium]MDE2908110.1 hypothetical protein [Chloroflexota bacterium]
MRNLRRQTIDASVPFEYYLAADVRSSRTDYRDDQAWTVRLGRRDEAALAFQTRYGGRAGLVSMVLMLRCGERLVYQEQSYAERPQITYFAPNLVCIEAAPLAELAMTARYWAMESRAAGGEFTLTNTSADAIRLQLELFGHAVINSRKVRLNVLTLGDGTLALHLGQIGNINPVAAMAGASAEIYGGRIGSPKIGRVLALQPGESARAPFAVAGLEDMRDSFSLAMNWASQSWERQFDRIERDAAAVPRISTGNEEWDRAIDLSYAHLIKAFIGPTEHLPHASFVANRAGNRGWSRRGDGGDHIRAWAGQEPTLAYLAASAIANIDGELAKSLIRNYLATQDESGFVDRRPGLGGQRQGILMMPLLARLSWLVHQRTGDQDFLSEVYPALVAFFGRWLQSDLDADDDGVPEWQSERQMGYVAFPTFGQGQYWAQGADIAQMETPDLLAYLISEADALSQIADQLGEAESAQILAKQRAMMETSLDEFWDGGRYRYRDRDTHFSAEAEELLQRGAGDQIHELDHALRTPAKVVVRVVGGVSQRPRITLKLEGRDAEDEECVIEAAAEEFDWQNRQGVYTTAKPLSHVRRIAIEGLSRVYKVYATTIDSAGLDINALMPLICPNLPQERRAALVELALDEARFLRPNGLTMVSASDRDFDPSNARGGGGIWMYWISLIGEGMAAAGFRREATALVKRALDGLTRVLAREGKLSQFYHADEVKGFGEDHHIGGIVPLKLLGDVLGVAIIAPDRVWLGGEFTWGEAITIEQHGVVVRRDADEIRVEFPSGHSEQLPADAPWQLLRDPTPAGAAEVELDAPEPPAPPLPSDSDDDGPLIIDVDDQATPELEYPEADPAEPGSDEDADDPPAT